MGVAFIIFFYQSGDFKISNVQNHKIIQERFKVAPLREAKSGDKI